jgi:hypothetical protein
VSSLVYEGTISPANKRLREPASGPIELHYTRAAVGPEVTHKSGLSVTHPDVHCLALAASITIRAMLAESAIAQRTRGLRRPNSSDPTRASLIAAIRPASTATVPDDRIGCNSCRDGSEETIPRQVLAYVTAVHTLHDRVVFNRVDLTKRWPHDTAKSTCA